MFRADNYFLLYLIGQLICLKMYIINYCNKYVCLVTSVKDILCILCKMLENKLFSYLFFFESSVYTTYIYIYLHTMAN